MDAYGLPSAYTLLIADDDRDTVQTVSARSRKEGRHVIEAHGGAEAPASAWSF